MAKVVQWDLCIVGKSVLANGETHIGVQVVSNAWWFGGADYDESRLSWLIGKWSEEVVIDRTGQGMLELLFQDMRGPYQVVPCLIFYSAQGDTVKIKRILPLSGIDIRRGIDVMLESADHG